MASSTHYKPPFLLQIVDQDGTVVRLPAGGALELDLITTLKTAIVARGVGLLCSEAHVAADIEAGITEAIKNLKQKTIQVMG